MELLNQMDGFDQTVNVKVAPPAADLRHIKLGQSWTGT